MTATVSLSPAQQQVRTDLMAAGDARPVFDPLLPARLLESLEERLQGAAARVGVGEMVVSKNMLGQVHQCERWFLAEEREGFAWSSRSAAGTVAHKAIELSVFCRDAPPPIELVDRAVDRLVESGGQWGPGEVLSTWTEAEMAELRSEASDRVTKFLECFPPLKREWWPVLESRARVDLCDRRIVLKGKVDLSLGRRSGEQARVLLVDFKTGAPHRAHVDDLRFYALLETIRSGVPPFRVASYYLDAARWHHEDITEDLLEATVHRVAEGAIKLIELRIDQRAPTTNPGPACGFCPDRDDCDGAQRWSQERIAMGLDG